MKTKGARVQSISREHDSADDLDDSPKALKQGKDQPGEAATPQPLPDPSRFAELSFREIAALVRSRLQCAAPDAAERLALEAVKGSLQHTKLLLGVLGLDDPGFYAAEDAPREMTLKEILLEQWNRQP